MKKNRIIALLAALLMMCACISASAEEDVFLKVGDEVVTLEQAQLVYDEMVKYYQEYYLQYNIEFGQADAESLRDHLVTSLIQEAILAKKAAELNLTEISDEEKAELRLQAEEGFAEVEQECISYYASMYQTYYEMDEESALEAAKTEAAKYLEENGISVDSLYEEMLLVIPQEKLYSQIVAECTVTDDEIEAEYQNWVAEDQEMYSDVSTYELYTTYYGYSAACRPEGYRAMKYIMLSAPEEIATALMDYELNMTEVADTINTLMAEMEALEGENTEGMRSAEEIQKDLDTWQAQHDLLQQEYDELEASILPALQETLNAISTRMEAGESFDALMEEFGQDEVMKAEPARTEGVEIHAESIIWDVTLKETVMALENVGDVSEPVLSGASVYIVQYCGDLPGGALPLDDMTREEIRASLLVTKQETVYAETLQGWIDAETVESYPEKLVLPEFEVDEEAVG